MKKLLSILLIPMILFISGCSAKTQERQTSIYSWNRELFDDLSVIEQLKDYQADRLYQGFYPSDFQDDEMETLVSGLRKSGIETVALFGDPSWHNADEVIDWTLKPLIEYNKSVGKEARIEKANYDIEWYLNENSTEAFTDYVVLMETVCAEAHNNDIEVVLCIPYWLPTVSTDLFKQLVSQADEISVMNYAVGREAENLSDICALAAEAGVKVESTFETQPVDGDITENITYAPKGKSGVIEAAEELREKCNVSFYVEEDHEGIINREVWEIVQKRLEEARTLRDNGICKRHDSHFLFGRILCGECGEPMVRRTDNSKGNNTVSWICRDRRKGKKGNGCKNMIVPEAELLEALSEALEVEWSGADNAKENDFASMKAVKIYDDGKIEIELHAEKKTA